jgi:SAM-dependent methyltransferase
VNLSRVKQPQRPSRSMGDAAAIGSRTLLISERLCEPVDLRAGERVLDVPCASGSAALAAARRFCRAVGVDVPEMLERARRRADAEGLEVAFLEGEAEDLPFPDGSFAGAGAGPCRCPEGRAAGGGQALRRVRGRHAGAAARLPGGRRPQAVVAVASEA